MIPLILLAVAATPGFQDIAALDRAVAAFAGHATGEEGGAQAGIDPRLRLRTCPTVALAWRSDAHDAVVVACSGPDWRLFVPVRRATSAPAAATPRQASFAKVEPVIRRGDAVTIEAGSSGFAVSRDGVATADAAPGARFGVRVDGTTAPVQAVAVAAGRATLPGWE